MSMPFEEELEPRSELSAETELMRGPFPEAGAALPGASLTLKQPQEYIGICGSEF
jgi:hypothetical protein